MEKIIKKLNLAPGTPVPEEKEVIQFINTLPEVYRQILILRFGQNLPVKEVAEKLKYSTSVIYRKQHSAIYRMQKKFNPKMFEIPAVHIHLNPANPAFISLN